MHFKKQRKKLYENDINLIKAFVKIICNTVFIFQSFGFNFLRELKRLNTKVLNYSTLKHLNYFGVRARVHL